MHRAYQPARGDATKFLDISGPPGGPFFLVHYVGCGTVFSITTSGTET
jgi:hypothetical protein